MTAIASAVVVGVAYALWTFDGAFLSGRGPYWDHLQLWDLDRAQALIGWRYYAHEPWHLPIFWVANLGYPEGANIVFTDSIPLVALMAKSWRALTGIDVNYLGAWMGGCWVLQGVAAAVLMLSLGVAAPIANLAGVLVALSAPILSRRFGHGALSGHFLLLLMLAAYFRLVKRPASAVAWTLVVVAPAASLLVTSYLGLMVAAIGAAAACEARRRALLGVRGFAAVGLGIPAVAVATMWVAGMLGPNAPAPQGSGYGHFSMNLLAPFFGDATSYTQRLFGPVTIDATGGQYEGFNYLGAGVLALVAVVLVSAPGEVAAIPRRHPFLTGALCIMSLYALGDVVFVGARAVVTFAPPDPFLRVASIFRSSGRFFWPAYYVVTFGTLAWVSRRFRPALAHALLIAATLLQVLESEPQRVGVAAASAEVHGAHFATSDVLGLAGRAERIFAFPSFECAQDDPAWPHPESWRAALIELTLAVSPRAMPINSAYVSRGRKNCAAERSELERGSFEPGTLFVVRRADVQDFAARFVAGACLRTDAAFVCLPPER
jgi:hypothetical protein